MKNMRSHQLIAAAVVAVALAAAGVAAAAGSSHGSTPPRKTARLDGLRYGGPMHGGGDLLAAAASYLGLTQSRLQGDLQSGKTLAQVADATSGKSSTGLVDALLAADKQRITTLVNTQGPLGPPDGGPFADAASYLGLTAAQLQTDLQSGKTLAQVADATAGKSAAGLIAALVADLQQRLAAGVKAGTLTQAQADQMASDATARITALVNGTGGPPGGPGPHGGFRFH